MRGAWEGLHQTNYWDDVLSDAPLALWKMNETSGSTLKDSSGNGRDATITGSITLGSGGMIRGVPDACVTFPGTASNYAEVAGASWMNVAQFTLEAVISWTATGTGVFMSRFGATGIWDFYRTTTVRGQGYTGTSTAVGIVDSGTTYNDGNPHHVALVRDSAGNKLYVDGVQKASTAQTTWNSSASQALRFGARGNNLLFFAGKVQGAAMHGSALSVGRIASHAARI